MFGGLFVNYNSCNTPFFSLMLAIRVKVRIIICRGSLPEFREIRVLEGPLLEFFPILISILIWVWKRGYIEPCRRAHVIFTFFPSSVSTIRISNSSLSPRAELITTLLNVPLLSRPDPEPLAKRPRQQSRRLQNPERH